MLSQGRLKQWVIQFSNMWLLDVCYGTDIVTGCYKLNWLSCSLWPLTYVLWNWLNRKWYIVMQPELGWWKSHIRLGYGNFIMRFDGPATYAKEQQIPFYSPWSRTNRAKLAPKVFTIHCSMLFSVHDGQIYIAGTIFHPILTVTLLTLR